jgi:endonuclease-3
MSETKPPKTKAAPRMPAKNVRPFMQALHAHWPDAKTELVYGDPFSLLVSVVLSAQTTDAAVNRATGPLFLAAPTPAAMAALGEEGLGRYIKSIGLWQAKAKAVIGLSKLLIAQHGGDVPHDRDALEALPGVGRKTANVVLNVAFGEPTIAVDTHLFRIGNRTGLAPGKNPREVEDGLLRRIPPERLRDSHHWLILHGRYVCKARRPECWRCVAKAPCRYRDKTPSPQPELPPQPELQARRGRRCGRRPPAKDCPRPGERPRPASPPWRFPRAWCRRRGATTCGQAPDRAWHRAAAAGTAAPARYRRQAGNGQKRRMVVQVSCRRTSRESPGNNAKKRDQPRLLGSRAANSRALESVSHSPL